MMRAHELTHPVRHDCGAEGGKPGDSANTCQYNEVILNAQEWEAHLPAMVDAIFFPTGGDQTRAQQLHQRFLAAFGLSSNDVPLLRLDLRNLEAPFQEAVVKGEHVADESSQK
eukprot:2371442-Prymnesium_polylepis.1